MIKEAISTLVAGEDLTPETMKQVMEEIMTGEATDAQKASFLTALAIKDPCLLPVNLLIFLYEL